MEDKDGADYYFNFVTRNTTVTPLNQPISDMMVGFINLYFYSGLNNYYYPLTRVEIEHPAYPKPPGPTPTPATGGGGGGWIVFLVIVILAGAGGAGYWYYKKRQDAQFFVNGNGGGIGASVDNNNPYEPITGSKVPGETSTFPPA